jgi:hypothetical protein
METVNQLSTPKITRSDFLTSASFPTDELEFAKFSTINIFQTEVMQKPSMMAAKFCCFARF